MSKPLVAIVGRPNVGKSTLVNRLATTKSAIVHESRGVTRDRSYHACDWNGREFTLIDTGGIESLKSKDRFALGIREQALLGCDEADVIVMVVDGCIGLTDEDETVAQIVRRMHKPVFLVVNKIDNPDEVLDSWNYLKLGLGEPRAISATHGTATGDLLDDIVNALPTHEEAPQPEDSSVAIAVIGRPNVGKSSLVNKLSRSQRSLVADYAGTTRDAIDITFDYKGQTIRLVDTAGMRKKTQVHEDVEYYSMVRGLQAMDKADVCLLVIDAHEGMTEQDQKLAGMAIDRGCALVLVLNKTDLLRDEQDHQKLLDSFAIRLTFATWAEQISICALTGKSVNKALDAALRAYRAHASSIKTSQLNNLVTKIREAGHTIVHKNRRFKIHYVTQTGYCPPEFTFFCNAKDLLDDAYMRFLENRLRETFDLQGTPIRLKFRNKD